MFVAYLSLALPFSHASNRYLDDTYVGRSVGTMRSVADIIYGGGNFIWLIALAFLISRPLVFGWSMVIWLAGGEVRAAILRLMPRATRTHFQDLLHRINAVMLAGTLVVMGAAILLFEGSAQSWVIRYGLLALGFAYPVILYGSAHQYFFGGGEDESAARGGGG